MRSFVYNQIGFVAALALFCLALPRSESFAQGAQGVAVEAQVRSVTGGAQLISPLRPGNFTIKRKDSISPGDVIETGGDGRVVISLTDGSQIIVLPNSKVTIKNFRAAASVRELLEITFGRVRVRIHHFAGKPNPYRLNSPAASIAVRGTAFIVDVQANGETLVEVFEGLVEVTPFANAKNSRLVTPGRRVVVRPGGEISLAAPGPGGELNGGSRIASGNLDPVPDPVRGLANAYQRSVDALAQNSLQTPPVLFAAFADAHLDSLDNPAYAAEFRQAQGRLVLLPSISETDRLVVRASGGTSLTGFPDSGSPHRFDSSFTPQFTFFSPIPNSRFTIGGSVTAARASLHALTLYQPAEDVAARLGGVVSGNDGAAAKMNAISSAMILARRFGRAERTALGVGIEHLSGDGSFLNVNRRLEAQASGGIGIESNADLSRTRVTLGFAREFEGGKKLGIHVRYGAASTDQRNLLRRLNTRELLPFDRRILSTAAAEAGVRWRSPLARRLFYGLEASYLSERIDGGRIPANQTVIRERDRARRGRFGGGLGFALRPGTVFSLDLSGGVYNTTKPDETMLAGGFRFRSERGSFGSIHAATQTDLGRRAFASASFLVSLHDRNFVLAALDSFDRLSSFRQRRTYEVSNLGAGWKFKPNLFVEYLFSHDHARHAPSHSLLLRYTFDLKIANEN